MVIVKVVLVILGIISSQIEAQFDFNFGNLNNLLGGGNRNQQNTSPNKQLDLGSIIGQLGQIQQQGNNNKNNQNNQNNVANQILGQAINAGINQVLNNGGSSNGSPTNTNNGDKGDTCVPNGSGSSNVGIRSGVSSSGGDCDCWEKKITYFGADLRIFNNPRQGIGAQECQKSCQDTAECLNWTWEKGGRRNRQTPRCWMKGDGFTKQKDRKRISGPKSCSSSSTIDVTSVSTARPAASCKTNGGGDAGSNCVFPFTYKENTYSGCILIDADDGIPWCSTLTDGNGQHVGGQGKWGHCPNSCNTDNGGSSPDPTVSVEGSLSNTRITQVLPWFPKDGKLKLPVSQISSNNIEGVTANDINNRFLALGLNQANVGHQTCRAPGGGSGSCRHLHHCLEPVFSNFFTFLTHMCIIQGRYIGVCCPETVTTTTTTTTTTTRSPTRPTATPAPLRACGTNAKRFSTRIVGGRPADPDEWPWLAALVHKGSSGANSAYCGATLISVNHVLTAAHCLAPFKQSDIQVKLGEYDFTEAGETEDQTFNVLWMKNHENYNDESYEHDIAMIKLDRPAITSNSVWPICLPPPTEKFTNRRAFVIGWGTIYFGGPTSSILQEVNVRVWEPKDCKKNYATLGRNVLDTMLCAGETNKDSCQGDSGGPLNCLSPKTRKWELCGVVSWGAKCAEPDFPGVYTRVTEYLDWIDNNSI